MGPAVQGQGVLWAVLALISRWCQDLFAVVDAGKKKGLLKKSCAGSPYLHLFEAKKKQAKVPQSGYMLPTEADLKKMYSQK